MRKLIYGGAVSLDGFLAGPSGELDWLHWSKDAEAIMGESMRDVSGFLLGRKTYQAALAMQPGEMPPDEAGPKSYVFSRTWSSLPRIGAELVRGDAEGFVRALKQQEGGKLLLMGGGELAQCLLRAGLVDEIGLNVHPVVLGRGIPVFRDPGLRLHFELLECRAIAGGCVFLNYGFRTGNSITG